MLSLICFVAALIFIEARFCKNWASEDTCYRSEDLFHFQPPLYPCVIEMMKSLYLFYCSILLLEIRCSTFIRTSPTWVFSQSLLRNSSRPSFFTNIAHNSANSTTGTGAHEFTNGTSLRRPLRGSILRTEKWTTPQTASVTNLVPAAASSWSSSVLSSSTGAKGEQQGITVPTRAQAHTGSSSYLALANRSSSWMSVEPTLSVNGRSSTVVGSAISASTLANTSLTANQNELRDQLSAVLPLVQTWINDNSDKNRNNAVHAINGTILLAEV